MNKPELVQEFYSDGNLSFDRYMLNDKYHREDGPAHIKYDEKGNIKYEIYYINNKKLTKSEWLVISRKRKLKTL